MKNPFRLACILLSAIFLLALPQASIGQSNTYEAAIATWKSYEDVAKWLEQNFTFNFSRYETVKARIQQNGPAGLLTRIAPSTFQMKEGYCVDAAGFAVDALNRVNPEYKARFVFIRDREGRSPHWVAGFFVNGKIMIMDYGAGPEWWEMKGVLGPYDSLDQYADLLRSLSQRIKSFYPPEMVVWRDRPPGQQDN